MVRQSSMMPATMMKTKRRPANHSCGCRNCASTAAALLPCAALPCVALPCAALPCTALGGGYGKKTPSKLLAIIALEIIPSARHPPFLAQARQVRAENPLTFPQRGAGDFLLDPVPIPHLVPSRAQVGGQGDITLIVRPRRAALPWPNLGHGQRRRRVFRDGLRQ